MLKLHVFAYALVFAYVRLRCKRINELDTSVFTTRTPANLQFSRQIFPIIIFICRRWSGMTKPFQYFPEMLLSVWHHTRSERKEHSMSLLPFRRNVPSLVLAGFVANAISFYIGIVRIFLHPHIVAGCARLTLFHFILFDCILLTIRNIRCNRNANAV